MFTGSDGLTIVKVAVVRSYVPGVKAGILTTALVALTTVNDRRPLPEFMWSTLTVPGSFANTSKAARPPGDKLGPLLPKRMSYRRNAL